MTCKGSFLSEWNDSSICQLLNLWWLGRSILVSASVFKISRPIQCSLTRYTIFNMKLHILLYNARRKKCITLYKISVDKLFHTNNVTFLFYSEFLWFYLMLLRTSVSLSNFICFLHATFYSCGYDWKISPIILLMECWPTFDENKELWFIWAILLVYSAESKSKWGIFNVTFSFT